MKYPAKVTVRALAAVFMLLCSLPLCALVLSENFSDRPASIRHSGQEVTLHANQQSMAGSTSSVKTQLPDTVYVDAAFTESTSGWGDDHFNTIMDAIARVEPGGKVLVAPGIYLESVTIDKTLTLQGADRETTIIRAQDAGNTINVAAADVVITGLNLQDGQGGTWGGCIVNDWRGLRISVEGCIIENNNNAFYIFGNNHQIKNNIIRNNYRGVWISGGESVTVSDNLIEGNVMQGIDGRGQKALIKDNHIRDNFDGITMAGGAVGNTLTGNVIEDNRSLGIGIFNETSTGHVIHSNTIQRNKDCGIEIRLHSRGHTIYNNYFSNNINAYDNTAGNTWNIEVTPGENIIGGAYLAGNYWSDYEGVDNTGNGIGDTELPYTSGGQIHVGGDFLPLSDQLLFILALNTDPDGLGQDVCHGTGNYAEGATVNIAASEVDGYLFRGWTGQSEDVAMLGDASARETSFTMPARNVTFTASFSSTTGVADRYEPSMRVYPVPASDVLKVEATEAIMQLRLIDMAGKVLSEVAMPGQHATVDVTHLLPGSYFLQVITISHSMVLPVQVIRQ